MSMCVKQHKYERDQRNSTMSVMTVQINNRVAKTTVDDEAENETFRFLNLCNKTTEFVNLELMT